MKMNSKKWMKGTIVGFVAIAVFLTVVLTAFGNGSKQKPTATDDGLTTQQKQEQKAAQADLIVDYDKVSAEMCDMLVQKYYGAKDVTSVTVGKTTTKTVKFDIGAMHPVVGAANPAKLVPRLWSTATNVPQKPQTLEAQQASVCHDPEQAAMVMNGIGKGSIGGVTVAGQNSWMQAQGDAKTAIKSWAQQCWTKTVSTHLVCAKTMAATATLLGKFASLGVLKTSSLWNYQCANGCLTANNVVPAFELNPVQEKNAFFLVISVTAKTGGCFLKYGFNMGMAKPNGGDQRLAGLTCVPPKPPKVPPKAPTSHPKPTPSTSHHTTPNTPTPTPTPTPSTSHKTCPCISKTSASQKVPTPPSGPVKSTGGNGPPNTGSGNKPTATAPGGKPSGPTGSAVPSQPAGGGNNSSSVAPPKPTCGPLSDPYQAC